jgi:hypothetical protein
MKEKELLFILEVKWLIIFFEVLLKKQERKIMTRFFNSIVILSGVKRSEKSI